jgi:hypothetical protein
VIAGGRHVNALFFALALLLGASCHGAAQTGSAGGQEPPADPNAATDHVRIVLIAPRDDRHTGSQVACGDSAVAVDTALPRPAPGLEGALRALLADHDHFDRGSGLLNALYASRLELAGVEVKGGEAAVRLTGYVEMGDRCDNLRMLAQLTRTALQFRGVSRVRLELDGQPLAGLLQSTGDAAAAVPGDPAATAALPAPAGAGTSPLAPPSPPPVAAPAPAAGPEAASPPPS